MSKQKLEVERFPERRVLYFAGSVPSSMTLTTTVRLPFDMVFELLRVKFYVATNLNLRIVPFFIRLDSGNQRISFIEYVGEKRFLDGDDETMIFNICMPFKKDERIGLIITNILQDPPAPAEPHEDLHYSVNFEFVI